MVRKAKLSDCFRINEIYNQNIYDESVANCHLKKTSEAYWIENLSNPESVFAVMEKTDGSIAGWGCIRELSIRSEYKGICELTIYVKQEDQNSRVSYFLSTFLEQKAREKNYKQVAGLVFEKNTKSIKKIVGPMGMLPVAEFKAAATKNDKRFNILLVSKTFINREI